MNYPFNYTRHINNNHFFNLFNKKAFCLPDVYAKHNWKAEKFATDVWTTFQQNQPSCWNLPLDNCLMTGLLLNKINFSKWAETYPSEVPQVRLNSVLRSRSMLGSRSWGNSSSSLSSSSCLCGFSSSSAGTGGSPVTESVWTDFSFSGLTLSVCTAAWESQ